MANLLDKVDVLVIGGGVEGCGVLRELSRFNHDIALLEKNEDVCLEVSKGAGMQLEVCHEVGIRPDYKGMVMKTPIQDRCLNLAMFRRKTLFKSLGIQYLPCGKLLVAFGNDALAQLKKCYRKMQWMGIPDLEFTTDQKRIKELEPNISPKVIGGLIVPTGTAHPWEITIALYENARQNGARAHFKAKAINVIWQKDKGNFLVETERGDIEAGYIVNATQFHAHEIAKFIGANWFLPKVTREQFITLDEGACKGLIKHIVREYDADGLVKCLITPEIDGELVLGRTYEPVEAGDIEAGDMEAFHATITTRAGMEFLAEQALKLVPSLPISAAITAYAGNVPGIRVKGKNGDWVPYADYILENSEVNPRFVNCVAPAYGLSATPGIGSYIVELLGRAGLDIGEAQVKENFNPIRPPLLRRFSSASNEERDKLIAKDSLYGHVVCRCKYVTEAEIVEAVRRGATTYEGVKHRTNTGMGRCQGGFDKPRVLAILARELGIPQTEVTIKGGTSIETMFKSKELLKGEVKEKRPRYVEPKFESEELRKSYEELLEEAKGD